MKKVIFKIVVLVFVSCLSSILIYNHITKTKEVTSNEDILVYQNNLENEFLKNTKYTFDEPNVILNPYEISPLTGMPSTLKSCKFVVLFKNVSRLQSKNVFPL